MRIKDEDVKRRLAMSLPCTGAIVQVLTRGTFYFALTLPFKPSDETPFHTAAVGVSQVVTLDSLRP
jgi:hypothetical protein